MAIENYLEKIKSKLESLDLKFLEHNVCNEDGIDFIELMTNEFISTKLIIEKHSKNYLDCLAYVPDDDMLDVSEIIEDLWINQLIRNCVKEILIEKASLKKDQITKRNNDW